MPGSESIPDGVRSKRRRQSQVPNSEDGDRECRATEANRHFRHRRHSTASRESNFLSSLRCARIAAAAPFRLICRLIHVSLDPDGDQATPTYARLAVGYRTSSDGGQGCEEIIFQFCMDRYGQELSPMPTQALLQLLEQHAHSFLFQLAHYECVKFIERDRHFEKERRYTVPLFQRANVWTEEGEWEPLWTDIERQAKNALRALSEDRQSTTGHFLGAIVLNVAKVFGRGLARSEIIDGNKLADNASDISRRIAQLRKCIRKGCGRESEVLALFEPVTVARNLCVGLKAEPVEPGTVNNGVR